jgi:hypothetical protein
MAVEDRVFAGMGLSAALLSNPWFLLHFRAFVGDDETKERE